jgi:acetyl esterase
MATDPRGTLHPAVRMLFEMMLANRPQRVLEARALREGFGPLVDLLNANSPAVPVDREVRIPGPAGAIRARVFAPRAGGTPLPVLLYLHGGGFVVMNPETHAKFTKQLALAADALVVSIDYRLSPEAPYPGPLDDCVGTLRWLRAHARELGGDPARIAVGGDSAGGNLSAALTLRLLAAGEPPPSGAVLVCPWTDLANATPSFQRFAPDDALIDSDIMGFFRTSYAPKESQWSDPFVSPLRGDLRGFPPCCVVVGEIDPLLDDGVRFAERVRAAGGEAELHAFAGMPHDFMLFLPIEEAAKSIAAMSEFLKRVLK